MQVKDNFYEIKLYKKQYAALNTMANEVLFGGAAGGGKSFLIRYAAIIYSLMVPGLQTYIFRRKFNDLKKNHLYGPDGFVVMMKPFMDAGMATLNYTDLRIDFKNGSQIHLCHCQHDNDVYNYLGAQIHFFSN